MKKSMLGLAFIKVGLTLVRNANVLHFVRINAHGFS